MKEQLISFETAKLAKEKGFDVKVNKAFSIDEKEVDISHFNNKILPHVKFNFNKLNGYSRPTQSLLQKWLREKYFIFIDIKTLGNHVFQLSVGELGEINSLGNNFRSYEEALEIGLQEALKLI